jgi:hypothetical protein
MVEIPGLNWRSYEISSRVCSFLGRFYLEIEKEGLKSIPSIATLLAYIVSGVTNYFPVVLNVCRRAAISFASLGDARPVVISLSLPLAS